MNNLDLIIPVRNKLSKFFIVILVAFLVIFPKGGMKVGELPITWGYCLLAIFSYFQVLVLLNKNKIFNINSSKVLSIISFLPFQLMTLFTFGFLGATNDGFLISFLISLFFIPWAFFICLNNKIETIDLKFLIKILKYSLLSIAIFGVCQFFYKAIFGNFIEIPYLTLNVGDVGLLDEKNIDRGGLFKLISTYNNGNIYGLCILMLLPLYEVFEKSKFKKYFLKGTLVLTLSRTVWIGLILSELGFLIFIKKISLKTVVKLFFAFFLIGILVVISLNLMKQDFDFLFDKDLGGRIEQFNYTRDWSIFPQRPFSELGEIIYLSILRYFGIIGLIFYIVMMTSPILIYLINIHHTNNNIYKKSLCLGLIIYLIASCSDGALLYIPVMAFYWFIAALLLSDNLPKYECNMNANLKSI